MLKQKLDQILLTPIRACKKRYIPLLLIYFAYGAQGFTSIAATFWEKDNLMLSTEQILIISVWISMPFTMKIIMGPMVDSVKILGSNRKVYVFIGALLIALHYILLAGMAGEYTWVSWIGGQYQIYLSALLIGVTGFMIQDVTADAMTTEVVDREGKSDKEIESELGMVQVLGRLSLYIAAMAVAGLSGIVASLYGFETVMWISLWIPLLSVVGILFLKLEKTDVSEKNMSIDSWVWIGSVAYVLFSIWMAFQEFLYGQEIIFITSLCILLSMAYPLLKTKPKEQIRTIILLFLVIFIYRAMPSAGPGFTWWAIDELGFDQKFFGLLKQIGSIVGVLSLWFMADWIVHKSIRKIFLFLVFVGSFLMLPDLILYYGLYENWGISAHTIALIDTTLESPLANIAMIPMLALIAFTAPANSRATWFALVASLMNLAITAQALGTQYLNKIYVISREIKDELGNITTHADYSQLGDLLILKILLGFFIPLFFILFFCPKRLR